jgi:WD40 repeat protein
MRIRTPGPWACLALFILAAAIGAAAPPVSTPSDPALVARAQTVLRTYCYRCHGQDGAIEGGFNYILDRNKLIARRKIVPGQPERSPLMTRVLKGRMPPPAEKPRPSPADVQILQEWIRAGAHPAHPTAEPVLVHEADVLEWILADLEKIERRSRRFVRYFSLVPLANAGQGPDELQTYRKALAKLINSLSWHPKITNPAPIDPNGLVLRIDLRDYLLDANLWNRLLVEYPYGILHDTAVARAVLVATATRVPMVRADWFIATASRAPLYYDLLQIPGNLGDLERQLRVDVAGDIQQERVARAGFNGSGVSRNNRILERHDSMNGAYWRTYDFEAVPQNLLERNILAPDQRNIFAFPLGPNLGEAGFKHAGGEVIFNLPNGLQGYVLVNANNQRVNRAPTEIVSDPKRPDRAVEAGLSCMHCHAPGILIKDDQVREHVAKNRKAFNRNDAELVGALYPPAAKTRALMEDDAHRFQRALEKTGNRHTANEVVLAAALRYEADVDLPTLAAEAGLRPADLLPRLAGSENLARNLGALKVPGATVSRQVVVQAFGDLVRELRLGGVFQPGSTGESLPDATGEVDPLEAQSSPANATAFSPDGTLAAFASADKSVRIFDIVAGRDVRRCIGHTASVWCVAFSPDGTKLLSGSKDGTVRLWDVATARELRKLEEHTDLVSAVAFSSDGHRALSAGYDQRVVLWDLDRGEVSHSFDLGGVGRYVHALSFSADDTRALVATERTVLIVEAGTGKVLRRLVGHTNWVTSAVFAHDGTRVLSGSDDGTARLWDLAAGKEVQLFRGHVNYVKSVALSADGKQALSGGTDATVRLWDVGTGKELRVFRKHVEPLVAVAFIDEDKRTLSGSRDAIVHPWRIAQPGGSKPPVSSGPTVPGGPTTVPTIGEVPALRAAASIQVGGTVGALLLVPERRALYFLNRTDGVVGRVDTVTGRVTARLPLREGTDLLAISRDGQTLVAVAPPQAPSTSAGTVGREKQAWVQVLDPEKLTLRKSFAIPAAQPYDLAVRDDGMVFLTASSGEWTDITAVDTSKGQVAATWGGVWVRSFVGLSPDQRRLYYSSQGVKPGTLDALVLPIRFSDGPPVVYRVPGYEKHDLGGEFLISPDGRYLLCKTGTVLRLAAERETDLQPHAKLEPFLAATVDVEGRCLYLLDREGLLKRYSYPEFRLQAQRRLPLAGYGLAVDGKEGILYVAGFAPRAVAERPRARGYGEIQVFSLKDVRAMAP